MTDRDDDPQLRWNPDAPAPRGTAADPAPPQGQGGPAAPAGEPGPDPAPKPVDWGRAGGAAPAPDDDGTEPRAAAPRHRRRRRRERDRVRSIVEWVAVIVGALVVALVVKTFLFQAFYIPSASMEPTLEQGDRVLVNKLSYDLHDVNRGDIVVFELPPDKVGPDGIKDLIKRVVGLPGEVIETRQGVVYIDGERLEEPYLSEGTLTDSPPIERQTIPEDHIFVMGDNRDNSADSRFANRGPIPVDDVVGRAFVQVWPPTDVGGL